MTLFEQYHTEDIRLNPDFLPSNSGEEPPFWQRHPVLASGGKILAGSLLVVSSWAGILTDITKMQNAIYIFLMIGFVTFQFLIILAFNYVRDLRNQDKIIKEKVTYLENENKVLMNWLPSKINACFNEHSLHFWLLSPNPQFYCHFFPEELKKITLENSENKDGESCGEVK